MIPSSDPASSAAARAGRPGPRRGPAAAPGPLLDNAAPAIAARAHAALPLPGGRVASRPSSAWALPYMIGYTSIVVASAAARTSAYEAFLFFLRYSTMKSIAGDAFFAAIS